MDEKEKYYEYLKLIYFYIFNEMIPELFLCDKITDELIETIEDAIIKEQKLTYQDIMKALNINENQYDISHS